MAILRRNSKPDLRVQIPPASLLALDALTQLELERRTHLETVPEAPFDIKASVMDRGRVASLIPGFLSFSCLCVDLFNKRKPAALQTCKQSQYSGQLGALKP